MASKCTLFVFFFLGATSTLGNVFQDAPGMDRAGVTKTPTVHEYRPQSADHNSDPEPDEPTPDRPVAYAAALRPAGDGRGNLLTLVVVVKTAPGWHIYSVGKTSGTGIATTLTLKLPKGIRAEGDWKLPASEVGTDGKSRVFQGTMKFSRLLRISSEKPLGQIELACELGYQACDPFSCLPPEQVTLKAKAEVALPR
jgi:DsbC/DsbD-like thiol-disulfide interchange protein